MASDTVLNRGLTTLLTIVLALASSVIRAESSPASWAFELLARVEQWQSAGPLDFLPGRSNDNAVTLKQVRAEYVRTPIYFEPNVGQVAEDVKFLARGAGYTLFLTAEESVLTLRPVRSIAEPETMLTVPGAVIRTRLEGATRNLEPQIEGLDRLRGISNYLIGNDPKQWRTHVPHYQRVRYAEVYPGIDLVYYGNPHQLEHDFIVAPGVDPAVIQLAISGAERVRVNAEGDLILTVPGGEVVQQAPRIYQIIDGQQQAVAGHYVLRNADLADGSTASVAVVDPMMEALRVGFEIAQYDRQQPLVIDPVLNLVYSSFLGGIKDDYGTSIAVDQSGDAYVTGATASVIDFPHTTIRVPGPADTYTKLDAFVSKFDFGLPGSASLVYSTYIGGAPPAPKDDNDDVGYGIAVDSSGFAYVTGTTASISFPTIPSGGAPNGGKDAFIVILDPSGVLFGSTYFGGTKDDEGRGIAVSGPFIYVTGYTKSNFIVSPGDNFPLANPFQPALLGGADVFVSQINNSLGLNPPSLGYSTYLGGAKDDQGTAIAVDDQGNIYITGSTASTNFPMTGSAFDNILGGALDGFIAKINPDPYTHGRYSLVYSTYLGGSNTDSGAGIAVDSDYKVYVTGTTASSNFPITPSVVQSNYGGNGDAFITKIDPDPTWVGMNSLIYSTYLGGNKADSGAGIAVTEAGGVIRTYITGTTASSNFPFTSDARDASLGGISDAFIAEISATGDKWLYVTYLGGANGIDNGAGIAADTDSSGSENVYVTGGTNANDFPFTPNAFYAINNNDKDAFVAKLSARDPATTLIIHYYTSILGRNPDAGGLTHWQTLINKAISSGADVKNVFRDMARYFFNSSEYTSFSTSNTQFINDLYHTFFNSTPSPGSAGPTFWLSQLAGGASRNQVMNGFLYSPQFTTFMQGLGF